MRHFHSLEFHQTTIKALLSRWRHFETTVFQKKKIKIGGVWAKSVIHNETKNLDATLKGSAGQSNTELLTVRNTNARLRFGKINDSGRLRRKRCHVKSDGERM